MTLGVRGIAENGSGQIMLIRHTYVRGWFLPGGGVEQHETAETALARELEEEAGVQMTGSAQLIGVYSNHPGFRNDHVLLYRIPADQWQQATPTSQGEIAERLWTEPHNLPADTTSGTRARLAEVFSNGPGSRYWSGTSE